MTRTPIDRATIEAVAQLLAQKFDPEQFILPVDLLVSTPECRTRQRNNPYAFLNTVVQTTALDGGEALPGFSCPVRDLFEL